MAELTATLAIDMASPTGLYPFLPPYAVTRSVAAIQITTPNGATQIVSGSFTYTPEGVLTGGLIEGIDASPGYVASGLGLSYGAYATLLAGNDVFGARAALFAGDDVIRGSQAPDRLLGFDGNDLLEGGFAGDDMNGNRGNDTVRGGDGNDTIHGGQGNDIVQGEAGADIATGSLGNDTVDGGSGADLLYGGQGDDRLAGGDGNDRLAGDAGGDVLYGQLGADTFFFGDASGADAIEDWSPIEDGDRIAVARHVNGTDIETPADVAAHLLVHQDGFLLDLGGKNVVLIRYYMSGDISAEHFVVV
ncbi:MAG: calcium-binding protein [Alphaproteobacteria bacterium]